MLARSSVGGSSSRTGAAPTLEPIADVRPDAPASYESTAALHVAPDLPYVLGKLPAHRPSRRHHIIHAAIRVFAAKGYTDTSIQHIAEEADVVPTAVYYHFSGKDQLFDVALTAVMHQVDEVVEGARGAVVTGETLGPVIDAVWDWIEAHPDEAKILYTHLPGATEQARLLRQEFEDGHVQRAFDYTRDHGGATSGGSAEVDHARATLAVRTLITLLMAIHPLRLEDGPFSKRSPRALRRALGEVSLRLVRGTGDDRGEAGAVG